MKLLRQVLETNTWRLLELARRQGLSWDPAVKGMVWVEIVVVDGEYRYSVADEGMSFLLCLAWVQSQMSSGDSKVVEDPERRIQARLDLILMGRWDFRICFHDYYRYAPHDRVLMEALRGFCIQMRTILSVISTEIVDARLGRTLFSAYLGSSMTSAQVYDFSRSHAALVVVQHPQEYLEVWSRRGRAE